MLQRSIAFLLSSHGQRCGPLHHHQDYAAPAGAWISCSHGYAVIVAGKEVPHRGAWRQPVGAIADILFLIQAQDAPPAWNLVRVARLIARLVVRHARGVVTSAAAGWSKGRPCLYGNGKGATATDSDIMLLTVFFFSCLSFCECVLVCVELSLLVEVALRSINHWQQII